MAKTASFAAVHFTVAFCVGTLLTGNPLVRCSRRFQNFSCRW